MGWNGSDRGRGETAAPERPAVYGPQRATVYRSRLAIRLSAITAIVAAGTCLWLWLSNSRQSENLQDHSESGTAHIVSSVASRNNKKSTTKSIVAVPDGTDVVASSKPRHSGPTNKVVRTKNTPPPTVLGCDYYLCVIGGRPLFAKPAFSNSAENIIGGLLSSKPGERFLPVELGQDFDDDFVESLKTPITIGEDDTDDMVILKNAVIKAKSQIEAGMAKGQKPSEVITAMRDEMNKIADWRDLMQEDFNKIKETGTADDIETYLREANQLLDEFGADHLNLPDDEIEEINARLETTPDGATTKTRYEE